MNQLANGLHCGGHTAECLLVRESCLTITQNHTATWKLRHLYARTLCEPGTASTKEDVAEALAIFEDVNQRVTRLYGKEHPFANASRRSLTYARMKLSALERHGVCNEGVLCAILERTWRLEEGCDGPRKKATG